jgi:hypothetical protein
MLLLQRLGLLPSRPFYSGKPMTDVSRIADSTVFKIVVPVLQTILSAAAIGAFVYVVGSLSTLQASLNAYQTSQALLTQRVDSLERSRDAGDKFIDTLRSSDQRQDFRLDSLTEMVKSFGRPK